MSYPSSPAPAIAKRTVETIVGQTGPEVLHRLASMATNEAMDNLDHMIHAGVEYATIGQLAYNNTYGQGVQRRQDSTRNSSLRVRRWIDRRLHSQEPPQNIPTASAEENADLAARHQAWQQRQNRIQAAADRAAQRRLPAHQRRARRDASRAARRESAAAVEGLIIDISDRLFEGATRPSSHSGFAASAGRVETNAGHREARTIGTRRPEILVFDQRVRHIVYSIGRSAVRSQTGGTWRNQSQLSHDDIARGYQEAALDGEYAGGLAVYINDPNSYHDQRDLSPAYASRLLRSAREERYRSGEEPVILIHRSLGEEIDVSTGKLAKPSDSSSIKTPVLSTNGFEVHLILQAIQAGTPPTQIVEQLLEARIGTSRAALRPQPQAGNSGPGRLLDPETAAKVAAYRTLGSRFAPLVHSLVDWSRNNPGSADHRLDILEEKLLAYSDSLAVESAITGRLTWRHPLRTTGDALMIALDSTESFTDMVFTFGAYRVGRRSGPRSRTQSSRPVRNGVRRPVRDRRAHRPRADGQHNRSAEAHTARRNRRIAGAIGTGALLLSGEGALLAIPLLTVYAMNEISRWNIRRRHAARIQDRNGARSRARSRTRRVP